MVRQTGIRVLFIVVAAALLAASLVGPAYAQGGEERTKIVLKGQDKPLDVIKQLRELGLVEGGGKIAFQVRYSAVRTRQEGNWVYPVGRGARLRDFVLHFEMRPATMDGETNSCGMAFRIGTNRDDYSAVMLTNDRRIQLFQFNDGEKVVDFDESVDEMEGVDGETYEFDRNTVHLVTLIAIQEKLVLFVNGLEIVTEENAASARGTFAMRLFNEEGNTTATQCNFSNIWTWSYDS